jgi:putative transposase
MPNHLHGILVVTDAGRGGSRTAPTIDPNTPRISTDSNTQRASINHATRRTSINPGTSRTSIDPNTPPTTFDDEPKPKPLGRLIGACKTVSTKEIN